MSPVKTLTYVAMTLALAASALPLQADEPPIVFASTSQKVTLSLKGQLGLQRETVMLSAFGRSWAEAEIMEDGRAQFVAPSVRSPIVFRLVPVADNRKVLGELVVYPEGWFSWDEDKLLPHVKDTQFVAVNVPPWFDNWLKAVGLAVERMPRTESLTERNWRTPEKPSLLILGQEAAGDGPADLASLAALYRTNVLVLEADWLGKRTTAPDRIVILPKHARAALIDLKTQDWALPASFRRSTVPWPGILNRLAWIDGGEYPMVEEIRTGQKGSESLRIVLSYLPWQDQLGRCAVADELLLRTLTETAKGTKDAQPWDGRWCLLYPSAESIEEDQRPVLAAALESAEAKYGNGTASSADAGLCNLRGYVLDLRGSTPPPENLLHELDVERAIEPRINQSVPLLILGNSPLLDSWRWLKLDRRKHQSSRPGVIWCPDRLLPPSLAGQLRLMGLLTEWNVFLGKSPGEKNNANRKNKP